MEEAARTFFRVVKTNPPTERDFWSHQALGIPLQREEDREIWTGVSVQATEQQARRTARIPRLGSYIAKLEVMQEGAITFRRTTRRPGHYTLWGNPNELLACVVCTISV